MNIPTFEIFKKVQAAGTTIIGKPTTGQGISLQFTSLTTLVDFVLNLVFGVGLALALLFVIIGGIKYITSQGDEGKATEARNTITNAVIGAVVIIAFRVLMNIAIQIVTNGQTLDSFLNGGS